MHAQAGPGEVVEGSVRAAGEVEQQVAVGAQRGEQAVVADGEVTGPGTGQRVGVRHGRRIGDGERTDLCGEFVVELGQGGAHTATAPPW
ncbi:MULTISPECIES: hypothetical protein [Streptomyces]|uniref:hypothetical protein n=1 Tax=Streptomyces TaxID=1883 RepID=UPI000694B57A|nr:hypothetical protein [Streptomyces sp. NRRL F-2890]